ncbi:MAG: hypothetical protein ACYCV7_06925 [Acidimicrobiales bacterium]
MVALDVAGEVNRVEVSDAGVGRESRRLARAVHCRVEMHYGVPGSEGAHRQVLAEGRRSEEVLLGDDWRPDRLVMIAAGDDCTESESTFPGDPRYELVALREVIVAVGYVVGAPLARHVGDHVVISHWDGETATLVRAAEVAGLTDVLVVPGMSGRQLLFVTSPEGGDWSGGVSAAAGGEASLAWRQDLTVLAA